MMTDTALNSPIAKGGSAPDQNGSPGGGRKMIAPLGPHLSNFEYVRAELRGGPPRSQATARGKALRPLRFYGAGASRFAARRQPGDPALRWASAVLVQHRPRLVSRLVSQAPCRGRRMDSQRPQLAAPTGQPCAPLHDLQRANARGTARRSPLVRGGLRVLSQCAREPQ